MDLFIRYAFMLMLTIESNTTHTFILTWTWSLLCGELKLVKRKKSNNYAALTQVGSGETFFDAYLSCYVANINHCYVLETWIHSNLWYLHTNSTENIVSRLSIFWCGPLCFCFLTLNFYVSTVKFYNFIFEGSTFYRQKLYIFVAIKYQRNLNFLITRPPFGVFIRFDLNITLWQKQSNYFVGNTHLFAEWEE